MRLEIGAGRNGSAGALAGRPGSGGRPGGGAATSASGRRPQPGSRGRPLRRPRGVIPQIDCKQSFPGDFFRKKNRGEIAVILVRFFSGKIDCLQSKNTGFQAPERPRLGGGSQAGALPGGSGPRPSGSGSRPPDGRRQGAGTVPRRGRSDGSATVPGSGRKG